MPWIHSPFFLELLKTADLSANEIELAKDFHYKGYTIVNLDLNDLFIKNLINDIDYHKNSDSVKTNSDFFSYNNSPRIVDAGKHISSVKDLALNKKISTILKKFYRKEPIPFSTINFIKGTEQPLHSDTIHFGSIPKGYLSACWVALEDIDENNGALKVVEGSHLLKDLDYFDLNIYPPKYMNGVEQIYREYEHYINEIVTSSKMRQKIICLKKGEAIIWSANLLHGGHSIKDKTRTRYSQVTHYNFEGCDLYYHPFFSIPQLGKYIQRNINSLNIKNY